jgi:hypothetical protein
MLFAGLIVISAMNLFSAIIAGVLLLESQVTV